MQIMSALRRVFGRAQAHTDDWEPPALSDDLEAMRAAVDAGYIPLSDYVKAREAAQSRH